MKLKSNVFWKLHENKGYFKVCDRVVVLNGIEGSLQEEYWNLVKNNTIENLRERMDKDKNLRKFIGFLKMLGAFYKESDNWSCYEKEYGLNLKNAQEIIDSLSIKVVGDEDLVESSKNILNHNFKSLNNYDNTPSLGFLIARKENISVLSQWNSYFMENNIPFLVLVLKPFKSFIGPFVIPGQTPCFNCIYEREKEGVFYNKKEEDLFCHPEFISYEPVPKVNLDATISIAATQITKYVFRKLKNQSSFTISGNVVEFDWLNDQIFQHRVLIHPNCNVCFPKEEKVQTDIWLNKE